MSSSLLVVTSTSLSAQLSVGAKAGLNFTKLQYSTAEAGDDAATMKNRAFTITLGYVILDGSY